MRIDQILKQTAVRMDGVTVDCDSRFPTVCISSPGHDEIFMQGDEAQQFIDEVEKLGQRCKSLNTGIIELALAAPYAENLWN